MSAAGARLPHMSAADMARQEWREALAAFDEAMERFCEALEAHKRALEEFIAAGGGAHDG